MEKKTEFEFFYENKKLNHFDLEMLLSSNWKRPAGFSLQAYRGNFFRKDKWLILFKTNFVWNQLDCPLLDTNKHIYIFIFIFNFLFVTIVSKVWPDKKKH